MNTKQILWTAGIALAVVIGIDFILPIKVGDNYIGSRFATKKQ